MPPLQQFAALAYVEPPGGALVLLISSRDSGRWVIPKGWPKTGLSPPALAALEARQEAGLGGEIATEPLGFYHYTKRLHLLSWARCRVDVFALRADVQSLTWKEKPARRQLWCPPGEAAALVREAGLSDLFQRFAGGAR